MLRFIKKLFSPTPEEAPLKHVPPRPVRHSQRVLSADLTESIPERRLEPDLDEVYKSLDDATEHVDLGPGKSVIARRPKYKLESGTYDTLEIVEDAEDVGIDPYNSGSFERKKNWDKPFPK